MSLGPKPVALNTVSEKCPALEEFKSLTEESRWVATRYVQTLAIYLALIGFSIKIITETEAPAAAVLIAGLVSVLNIIAYYAVVKFVSMVTHALNRLAVLADYLETQRPHPLRWGYIPGLIGCGLCQVAILVLLWMSIRELLGS